MPKSKKLPPEVIEHWPEVLNDVEIDVIPIEYLDSIKVQFSDGKIWDIDIKKTKRDEKVDVEDAIEDLFKEYADSIVNVEFKIDTKKVKADIKKRTTNFMKKRK